MKLLQLFGFRCKHRNISWPHTRDIEGSPYIYVCCLDCGEELAHDLLTPNDRQWRWETERRVSA